ncbi:hypothetical protein A8D61_19330 [Burkholderia cenocepacia]|nr:hypothetical protein A8D61_19330 [Burkholderia cenocepacia]AQQ49965.1 hypothetical protein A8F32_30075 [Burkholderia cenocepacia]ONI94847.1 hypothetical protein A8F53_31680 [Burkholderia cenocepacia]ONJ07349.1 hypothetical protein A8F33_12555 [Burkholderia cenocepacia]ONJ20213.1 hypothetical protein A8D82_15265 [Burkholderia cenocepacia]
MVDRRRLRDHLGRAALAWLSRMSVTVRAPRPPGRSRGRGAVLCFASFSIAPFQPCSRSC